MSTIKRVSLSLPVGLADDLDYIHRRVGVSKSAFVASLLGESIPELRALLEELPVNPGPEDLVRFRGGSVAIAESRMSALHVLLEDSNAS